MSNAYARPASVEEALELLGHDGAAVLAGGTDLAGQMDRGICVPELFVDLWGRVQKAYNPEVEQLGTSVASRITTWVEYWHTSTPQVWLLGQGFRAGQYRVGSIASASTRTTLL